MLGPPRLLDQSIQERANLGVGLEETGDVALGVGLGNPEVAGEPVRADPVDDPEVHPLGDSAHPVVHLVRRDGEQGGRRAPVQVLPALERRDQGLVPREMREDPQFDLRVVRPEEDPSGRGHE